MTQGAQGGLDPPGRAENGPKARTDWVGARAQARTSLHKTSKTSLAEEPRPGSQSLSPHPLSTPLKLHTFLDVVHVRLELQVNWKDNK